MALEKAKHTYGNITIVMGHNRAPWKHKWETGYWEMQIPRVKMWFQIFLHCSCHLLTRSVLRHETSAQKPLGDPLQL